MRIEEVRTNGAIVVLETTRPFFNDDTGFGHISQSDFSTKIFVEVAMMATVEKSSARVRGYPRHIHITIEPKEQDLNDSDISDITPLAGFTKLEVVDLGGNGIPDASLLVGLTRHTYVDLEDNPLNQASIETHIPAIEAYGVRVDFDLAA